MFDQRLKPIWLALRITFGVVPIVAGLDKFFNVLTRWENYLSPLATSVIPVTPHQFMLGVGIIEIIAGALVLSPLLRVGSVVVGCWLIAIAVNLLTKGQYFDIAVRDLVMAIGAFSLARLETIRLQDTAEAGLERRRAPLRPADARV